MIDFVVLNPKQNPDLNGIFSYFRYYEDPIPEDFVQLYSVGSLYDYESERNILSQSDSAYTSINRENAWITFEFVNKYLYPTFYTFRTVYDSNKNLHFP